MGILACMLALQLIAIYEQDIAALYVHIFKQLGQSFQNQAEHLGAKLADKSF